MNRTTKKGKPVCRGEDRQALKITKVVNLHQSTRPMEKNSVKKRGVVKRKK